LNRGKRFCRPLRNHSATWPSEGSSLNVYSRLGNGCRWRAVAGWAGAFRRSELVRPNQYLEAAARQALIGRRPPQRPNPSRRRFLERKAPTGATEICITIGARAEFECEVVHIRPGRPRRIVVQDAGRVAAQVDGRAASLCARCRPVPRSCRGGAAVSPGGYRGAAMPAKWRLADDWWSRHIAAERRNRARS
jgi:hypothetical protein